MSELAVMPLIDYKAVCDKVREKTNTTELIKSGEFPDKIDAVYSAGQLSVMEASKAFKGNVSGNPIAIKDVSPIEHNVGVKITAQPAFDGLLKDCTFEDTDFGYIRSSPFTVPTSGHYTVALNLKDDSKWSDWVVAWSGWRADDSPPYSGGTNPSYGEWLDLDSGYTYSLFLSSYKGLTASDILSGTIEIGDNVVAPPVGDGDVDFTAVKVTIESTTYTANADGIVEGVKSRYPSMSFSTDTEGVIILVNYYRDIDKVLNNLAMNIAISGGN